MKKFNAFTLAEVLITLGVIGVVAAMTMPTLINQTNGAQYKAAYKKALSAISQGVTLNVALDDESFADTVAGTAGSKEKPTDGVSIASLLSSRMNVVKTSSTPGYSMTSNTKLNVTLPTGCSEEGYGISNCPEGKLKTETKSVGFDEYFDTWLFFNDSSAFGFKASQSGCIEDSPCLGVIDVNGAKGPNKETTCTVSGGECTADSLVVNDIYPVSFYDQTILPATPAGKTVLYGK